MNIHHNTPIIVGVGEASESVGEAGYAAMSPVALAAKAARVALEDTGIGGRLAASIDTIAAIRQFEISMPGAQAPFGRADNVARAIGRHVGANPRRAVLEVMGGQCPQHLVNEFAGAIAQGEAGLVLIAGSEAISTVRALAKNEVRPDWTETVGGQLEDRGFGLEGLLNIAEIRHGLGSAAALYGLLENARRHRLGLTKDDYRWQMAALFARFSEVAATNPHAADRRIHAVDEIATVTEQNRMIADPYSRLLVSRDQVNQGAAILLTSVGEARALGIPEQKWVFLHGHADLREREIMDRENLGASPASVMAVQQALRCAGISLDQINVFDLYSCFPIAVFNICDGLGLSPNDPRGFTATGGLPYFGGPGNNYSSHAIAAVVRRVRAEPGSIGLVGANGGMLSKYSVGIYAAEPRSWRQSDCRALQLEIDGWSVPAVCAQADGWAQVETYTISHERNGMHVVLIVKMENTGERTLARSIPDDLETVARSLAQDLLGQRVLVRSAGDHNLFTFDRARMEALRPSEPEGLRQSYEFIMVARHDHLLEVTINRPEVRNALHSPAHLELEQIFDAFEADPDLWVAILNGAGTEAFCAGNDLKWAASGKPMILPRSGFGGLTTRGDRRKPVIAAVNGFALGGGLEIALACDLIVVDEAAELALPETRVGLVAAVGGLARLPRNIPPKLANDLILTGRRLTAQEALAFGLASRIAPRGEALTVARNVAQEILLGSPTSVRVSMEAMQEYAREPTASDAARLVPRALNRLIASEDMMEGMTAFAQKRKPEWKNR